MDPISTAIGAALANLAEPAVKDAYEALKGLMKRKFGQESKVAAAIGDLEEEPSSEGRRMVLQEKVAASGAQQDDEVIRAAETLMEKVTALPGGGGIVQNVTGNSNIFSGSGNVHIHHKP
jgi:hypothetical protein